ncbi:phage antirepressor KilAC domain-containing protein [uncultured Acetobacterium sp.]|uniref:phage antirepressor KilAC domain-containing protein n=1 Tax=uncultured Acetobacterium sp. TaxID=217139 RepID=UPI0025D040F3|nr:phage antirepressor KilAC domain-containing protein [uncultured Acetobacterium sp.]
MSELVRISYDSERPTVSGRDLHQTLQVKTPYTQWFERMKEYGFSENSDFVTVHKNVIRVDGTKMPQQHYDHQLTLDMAKEICMIQRSAIGRKCRQYFLELEKAWNSPEAIMARALQFADSQLALMRSKNTELADNVAIQNQQITEMKPKVSYYDVVLNCKDLITISVIAKDFGKSARWMNRYLHDKKIQFKQGDIWLLYQKYAEKGYTSTKTNNYAGSDGEQHIKPHTYWTQKGRLFIYDLLKVDGIIPLIELEMEEVYE